MPFAPTVYESPRSLRGRQDATTGSLTREFIVLWDNDPTDGRDLVLALCPIYFNGLARKAITWESMGPPDCWYYQVEYGVSAVPDGLKPDELSFRITAGTQHITQSLQTIYRLQPGNVVSNGTNLTGVGDASNPTLVVPAAPDTTVPSPSDVGRVIQINASGLWTGGSYTVVAVVNGKWQLNANPFGGADFGGGVTGGTWGLQLPNGGVGSAPDMQGAIGVTLDSVEGCDILVPKMEFSYSSQRSFVDWPYIRTVRGLVGHTNNATFFGFDAGTLLYLGCEPTSALSTLDDGSQFIFWNLAHAFAYEPNRSNINVGPIVIPQKNGWNYVWAKYAPTTSNNQLAQQPTAVYVERVYDDGDFTKLEIGF